MTVWDLDLRSVWLNHAAERQTARAGADRPPNRLGVKEAIPDIDTEAVEAAMRKVLDDGDPVVGREFTGTGEVGRGHSAVSVSIFRIEGPSGRPIGVCTMVNDVDDARSWSHLSLLTEAGTRIGSTLDVLTTAQELADLAVPRLADYVTVDLVESVYLGEEPLNRLDSTSVSIPVFHRAGVASIKEGGRYYSLWHVGDPVFVPPASPFTEVLSSGRPHWEPVLDSSPGTWLDHDPDRAKIIRETGMHSLMIVPLTARGETLGIAVFVRTENPKPFTRRDLLLAEGIASRAGLSLDNASRFTHEHTATVALQRDLLPRALRGGTSLEVASRYLPADTRYGVGGDWFDVIPLTGGRTGLVIGDVVGHGITAAATMGMFRTAIRALAYADLQPAELLTRLDELVVRLADDHRDGAGRPAALDLSATCVYAVYDPATRTLTVARAGHPPPALVRPDGTVTFLELPAGTPIGLGLLSFQSVTVELPAESVMALYTDGLVESRDRDIDSGMRHLGTLLGQERLPLDDLCSSVVTSLIPGSSGEDDRALLLVRTLDPGPEA